MKRVLKFFFAALTATFIISVSVGAWLIHDGDWIRKKTGSYVSELAGRKFLIDGPMDIDFSLHPVINAYELRFTNAPWAGDTDLARLQHLRISIDLLSLFSDQVVIHFIELEGLTLELTKNDQGDANWDLFSSSKQETDDAKPMDDLPVVAERMVLKDMHATLDAPGRTESLEFVLVDFEAVKNSDGLAVIDAHGSLQDFPLEFRARAGPLKHLIIGGGMELKVDLRVGELDFNLLGEVTDSLTGQGTDVSIKFSGPDITWVTKQLALPEFTQGAFDFDLSLETENYDTVLNLVGDLGHLDINANGKVDDFRHPREGQARFDITGPDLHSLGEALGEPNLPSVLYDLKGDVSAHLGIFEIHAFQFVLGENKGQITGKMGDWPNLIDTEIHLNVSGPDLSQWGPLLRVEELRVLPFSYSGHLTKKGSNVLLTNNRLDAGESYIELAGTLGQPPEFMDTSIDVDLYFPNLSEITILPDNEELPPESLTLKGGIARKEQMIWLNNMHIELGKNTALVNGQIALSEDMLGSKIHWQAEIPNIASVGRYFQVRDLPNVRADINADLDISTGGLGFKLSESRLGDMMVDLDGRLSDLQSLDGLSASFQLEIPSLRKIPFYPEAQNLPDLPGRVTGDVEYLDQHVTLANVSGSVASTKFHFDSLLSFQENFAGSHVEFELSGLDYRPLILIGALAPTLAPLPVKFRASGRIEKRAGKDRLIGLELILGNMQAGVDGTVDDLFQPSSADLTASVSMPSLSELDGLMDRNFPDLPFNLDLSVSGTGSRFILDPLRANLGPSNLSGKISMDLKENPVIEGWIRSDFLDLAWLAAADEGEDEVAETNESVFPDTPIPYREYGNAKIDLNLSVDRLKLIKIELNEVKLELFMDEDHFQLNSFEIGGPLGEKLSGRLAISGSETETQLEFEMEGDELRLGIAVAEGQDVSTYPPTSISMELVGKGATWHQLASSLDGRIRVVQGEGLIANAGLELLFSDLLSELFNTLNPFAEKSVYTELECAVINAEIDSGIVLIDPIIFHTEQITILSGGQIDLETEKLDLEFQTKVRKGIGISASMVINPFIKLGGTLSESTIELDPAGVAFTGSVAVATVGLSLVGKSLFDRFISNKDPCGEALKKLEQAEKNPGSK